MNKKNLIILNKKYGLLTPIEKPNLKNKSYYKCKCDCGNIKLIRKDRLFNGCNKSCGCLKSPNLIDKKFKMLKVISFSGNKNGERFWKCKCDCGNEKIYSTEILSKQISCGCIKNLKGRLNKCYRGFEDLSASHWNKIKSRAKKEGHTFSLDIKEGWNQFLKQQKKCILSGVELKLSSSRRDETTASLDRIDSSKGYTIDNIQWVHKRINKMKSNDTDIKFINWCKLVTNHNKNEI